MSNCDKLDNVKNLVRERLGDIRRIKHDFAATARIDPVWEGIVGQCSSEERFLEKLVDKLDDMV